MVIQNRFNLNNIPEWSWFFLRKKQSFLFFKVQSTTAQLRFGPQNISMNHLIEIIMRSDDYSKMDHGLTRTDLNRKTAKNYSSCVRIASDDVQSVLKKQTETHGTLIYLQLLRMIITAYIEKTTAIQEREYFLVRYKFLTNQSFYQIVL